MGLGYLKFEDYKNFIDANKVARVELSNNGEIFLNPELYDIIKYSYQSNIRLTAINGVNGNYIDDNVLEGLVKYRFSSITFSIDGASQDTYVQYRVNGNFDKVINNIKRINYYKAKYNSPYPEMVWKFILFGHNLHEISKARSMAKDLNMFFMLAENWFPWFFPIDEADMPFVNEQLDKNLTNIPSELYLYLLPERICPELWTMPAINWDGRLFGCCVNKERAFNTNVFEVGLINALNHPDFLYAKKMVMGKVPPKAGNPCTYCGMFKDMQEQNDFINPSKHIRTS